MSGPRQEDPNTRPTTETYKGCQILLTPNQEDEETWVGEYVVIDMVHTESPYTTGFTDDSFPSPNAARAAALLLAITIIDSRSATADTVAQVHPLGKPTVTESNYNGRAIKLRSGQQDDGTWICQYTIIGFGPMRAANVTG
ncbi:MAG: hypothetical protein H8K03_21290 [Nitrospira sp.]